MDEKRHVLLFTYGIDLDNRRIYLGQSDEDGWGDAYNTIRAIHLFNDQENADPIEIIICSDGGSVDDMFAVYDAIRTSKAPIHTIGTGSIASAAVLMLAAGHSRFATENAWLMHHLSHGLWMGDEREIVAQAESNKRMASRTYELLARHSKKKASVWERLAKEKGEVWLDSKEMLEWGIIDEIIPSTPVKRAKNKLKPKKIKTKDLSKLDLQKEFNDRFDKQPKFGPGELKKATK